MVRLFWKSASSDIELREQQLAQLEKKISSMRSELLEVKKEAAHSLLEVDKRREEAQKEEEALKALRKEITDRVRIAEKKEAQLKGIEKQFLFRERQFKEEENRFETLKKREADL